MNKFENFIELDKDELMSIQGGKNLLEWAVYVFGYAVGSASSWWGEDSAPLEMPVMP